jgi:hypothetical protein
LAAKRKSVGRPIAFCGRDNGRTIYSGSGRVTTALPGDPLTSILPRRKRTKSYVRERIAAVLDQIEAQQNEQIIPDDIPLLELADMVFRGKVKLSPPQMRMLTSVQALRSRLCEGSRHVCHEA